MQDSINSLGKWMEFTHVPEILLSSHKQYVIVLLFPSSLPVNYLKQTVVGQGIPPQVLCYHIQQNQTPDPDWAVVIFGFYSLNLKLYLVVTYEIMIFNPYLLYVKQTDNNSVLIMECSSKNLCYKTSIEAWDEQYLYFEKWRQRFLKSLKQREATLD